MTVLEVILGVSLAITAIYWLVDHLLGKCAFEDLQQSLARAEEKR